ncbi:MAG: TolC family protein [Burkholderiales bacterium]|nr:MAG: TolC family protein [Burkholderiales bacterium]
MMDLRRFSPPFTNTRCRAAALSLACLSAAWGPALAQPSSALLAADPATPTTVAAPLALPASGSAAPQERPSDIAQARDIWQRANERVAEFPRGHIDLLRWEAKNPGDPTPAAPDTSPRPELLDAAQALRQSLRLRPDLFTHADMNALEKGAVQVAYARHVREVQRAWVDAVSARQSSRHMNEVWDATRTGSELGRRMVVAGNWSQAKLMREQLTEASAWQASVNAQGEALGAQERLAQLLGLWDAKAVAQLSERLPDSLPPVPLRAVPGADLSEATLEAAVLRADPLLALQQTAARRELAAVSASRRQAWNAALETALAAMPEPGTTPTPPHIANLSLLRDHSLEGATEAEASLLRAASQRRSMARQAWAQLQTRHAGAVHAQNVVAQLQAALEQETLLRYNGMLQSSWELLASARERMQSLDVALQARRDYWRAQADLQALLAGAEYAGPDTPSNAGASAANAAAGH